MNATTPKSLNPSIWFLAIAAIAIAAFCLTLAVGVGAAYAGEEGDAADQPAIPAAQPKVADQADGASASTQASAAQASATTTAAAADTATAPAASQNDEGKQDNAVSQENATNQGKSNNQSESPSSTPTSALVASTATTYPGDNGTMDVFIGLAPTSSNTCSLTNVSTTRDSTTNAVYVELNSEVGQAIDLAVAIDYMRFGNNVYDARNASGSVFADLPKEDTSSYTMTYANDGLVFTWYTQNPPLGQGVYYSDPSTNPALSGGSVSQAANLASYQVKLEDFICERGTTWGRGKSRISVRPASSSYKTFEGLFLPEKSQVFGSDSYRYMQAPLYFEEAKDYTFIAQFTYMQEYRSKNTADENVGYVLYASNPVVFTIHVQPKPVVTVHVTGYAEDVGFFEFTNDETRSGLEKHSGFFVDLEKLYYTNPDVANLPPDASSAEKEWYYEYTYCNRNLRGHYEYATPGKYRLRVVHETGKYVKYVESFEISEAEYRQALASQGHTIYRNVMLELAPPVLYTISFYMDDGTTLISSGQYNNGSAAESINRPANPTKATTEYYSYEFKDWEAVPLNGGQLDWGATRINWLYPVTCDTNYIAVFKETLLKNNAGQKVVYATGGLFSNNALPNGVLGYALSSQPLSSSQQASVVAAHSNLINSAQVLGMVQVDLVQHNDDDDRTTTTVTEGEGLNGMHLKFNMEESGIDAVDGDELTVLQIHKADENSLEQIIPHQATVVNGEIDLTLDGRLSTFVFLRAANDDSGDGASGDGTSGGQADGGTSGESGNGEQGNGESGDGTSGGEAGNGEPGESTGEGSGEDVPGGSSDGATGEDSAGQPAGDQSNNGTADPTNGEPVDGGQAGDAVGDASTSEPAGGSEGASSDGPSTQAAANDDESASAANGADDASVRAMPAANSEAKSGETAADGNEVPVGDVKGAPTSAQANLPATGDPLDALVVVLAALFAFVLAFRVRKYVM